MWIQRLKTSIQQWFRYKKITLQFMQVNYFEVDMKLPKSVNVMGKKWIIKPKKNLIKNGFEGQAHIEDRTIYIDPSAKPKDILHTLIHEIKHAHQFESGIYQTMSNDLMEVDAETTATVFLDIFNIRFKT